MSCDASSTTAAMVEASLQVTHTYGVQTVTELDELVQSGHVHEAEAFEDYSEFDYLEAERDLLLESLKELD